ncbi:hypothetical protein J2S73_002102 [Amorphus orientalis]|uniref:Uncharacterized protein n=1 Tax=Amorphus orientalis TaxID=649198 RepID=A0AAE4AT28_9HYPH|nr:hypothetical protein [Amorphus orientalis]
MTQETIVAVTLPLLGSFGKGRRAAFSSRHLAVRSRPDIRLPSDGSFAPTAPPQADAAGRTNSDRGEHHVDP